MSRDEMQVIAAQLLAWWPCHSYTPTTPGNHNHSSNRAGRVVLVVGILLVYKLLFLELVDIHLGNVQLICDDKILNPILYKYYSQDLASFSN